jgi:hypothetical protein
MSRVLTFEWRFVGIEHGHVGRLSTRHEQMHHRDSNDSRIVERYEEYQVFVLVTTSILQLLYL